MAKFYKILHWDDDLRCNHNGKVMLHSEVEERDAEIQNDKRIVTEDDLLHNVKIEGCTQKPTKCSVVETVLKGRAKNLLLAGEIPLLGNLVAKTDQGGIVRWKKSLFANLVDAEVSPKKRLDPGFDDVAYLDSKKILTVGVGHNVKSHPVPGVTKVGDKIDAETASNLFDQDQLNAEGDARTVFDGWQGTTDKPLNFKNPVTFDDLTGEQQQAMTDLIFNMGPGEVGGTEGLRSFKKFLNYMRKGDFEEGSKELLRGKDAKTQSDYVKDVHEERAGRVSKELKGSDGDTEAFAEPE